MPTDARAKRSEPHIAALDGLRGVAVCVVFCLHYGGGNTSSHFAVRLIGQLSSFGVYGVTLFFLLSGFLITGILWDSRGDEHWWRNFYVRRSLRIFPLYYATILIFAVTALVKGVFVRAWSSIWVLALYLQDITPLWNRGARFSINLWTYHYWSLAVEEHFYLIWPICLYLVRSRRSAMWMCSCVCLLSLVFQIGATRYPSPIMMFDSDLLTNAGALSLGGLLAFLYRGSWHRVAPWFPWIVAVSFVVLAALAFRHGAFELAGPWRLLFGSVDITILLASVLGLSLEPGLVQRSMSVHWLRWIGKISFGVYIFHVFFVGVFSAIAAHIVRPDNKNGFLVVRFLVAAVLTLLLAWLSYTYFEKPFLALKDRFAPRSPASKRPAGYGTADETVT